MSKQPNVTVVRAPLELGSKALDDVESAAGYCEKVLVQLSIFAAALESPRNHDRALLASQIARQLREDCVNDLDVAREMLQALVPNRVQS